MSTDRARLRASDADREAVADALQAHCAAGRLQVDELEQRLSAALAARTLGELDLLLVDLPGGREPPRVAAAEPARAVKLGPPGPRAFHQRHELPVERDRAFRDALQRILPAMIADGYSVADRRDGELIVFERNSRPAWVWVVCVVLFPIGLLALIVNDRQRVVVTFGDAGDGRTAMSVQGTARRDTRRAFAELNADPA